MLIFIFIGVPILWRVGLTGNAMALLQPLTQIEQLTPLTAEGSPGGADGTLPAMDAEVRVLRGVHCIILVDVLDTVESPNPVSAYVSTGALPGR